MKRAVFAVILIFIAVFLISGCAQKDETTPPASIEQPKQEEVKVSCDDDNACTRDVYNAITKACEHTMMDTCCGNDKCEPDERCNEETHRTICVEDCALQCPGFLIIHKSELGTTTDDFSYTCFGSGCTQTDEDDFVITGKSDSTGIKTVLTNIGELYYPLITSNFYCQELTEWAQQATTDNAEMRGIKVKDYFGDNKQSAANLKSVVNGNNSITYYLNFDTTNIQSSTKVRCVITIQSTDFKNQQDVLIDFVKPAA